MPGTPAGRSLGLHPALAPLLPLYTQGRLGWIANVGPLVQPSTAAQVLANAVDLPPLLLSHSDQVAIQQSWTVSDDTSGWAGRTLELLPDTLRHATAAISMSTSRTLVQGRHSAVSFLPRDGGRYWGTADLSKPQSAAVQNLNRIAQWQFTNAYEAEFARTLGNAIADSTLFTRSLLQSTTPTTDFGTGGLADNLRTLATLMPALKAQGLRRQVFLVEWGNFDTHADQLGSASSSQDTQLPLVARALAGFEAWMRATGMDQNVVTLVMSDFGRGCAQAQAAAVNTHVATTGWRWAGRWQAAMCWAATRL